MIPGMCGRSSQSIVGPTVRLVHMYITPAGSMIDDVDSDGLVECIGALWQGAVTKGLHRTKANKIFY